MFGKIASLVMMVLGALTDPKTGKLSVTRTAGVSLLTIGAGALTDASTTVDLVAGSITTAAGIAAIAARTKSTER